MKPILNIAAYRFVALAQPVKWHQQIADRAAASGLKGTVLLAEEGINLVLAGAPTAVREFVAWLRSQLPFADLRISASWSEQAPFGRLRVKVKPEIIRMDRPELQPQVKRAPAVVAKTLARWLDAGLDDRGRELVMLDTRNGFEVGHGRFRGALDWNLEKFSEFPQAFDAHRNELRGRTVVTYCTGGIRCEKAALWMAKAGVDNVLQLDGGILKYFEEMGRAHFDGVCFVFDRRGAIDATLTATKAL